jgi:hypothetical protein
MTASLIAVWVPAAVSIAVVLIVACRVARDDRRQEEQGV